MYYNKVVADIAEIPNCINFFENELISARKEVHIFGRIETQLSMLPGITEHRYCQLQEIEAILEYLNIELRKIRSKHFRIYLEAYARALTSRDAEKYSDAEPEVTDFENIINSVALIRNQYLGVIKAIESKNFMLGHICKLRTAGIEDSTI
jgi:uncharacterized protein YfdQ (DUF2303 family)